VAIEVQISSLSVETIMQRTIEYARNGIYVLWLLQWTPDLDAKRYAPQIWEKWLHAAYFGRVYYWIEGLSVAAYHFDPQFKSVPKKSWYSESGEKIRARGYSRRSKRYRMAVRGETFNLATDFIPTDRKWWEGNGLKVPDAKLFLAKLKTVRHAATLEYARIVMRRTLGNRVKLGLVDGGQTSLEMTPEMRATHLYLCGSTGTGKSKMLEYLIRQDIANWSKSKCGLLLLDPHGSLYDSLINWISWQEPHLKGVPIVPIDLRQTDWTVAYNVMRPRTKADPAVIVNNFVQAMSYVWGVDGTDRTPLFARVGSNVLWTLYEKQMTLLETEYLIDRTNMRLRTEMTAGLSKRSVAQDWAYANGLSPRDFDAQISSTVNRFHSFLHNEKLRSCSAKMVLPSILERRLKRARSSS